MFGRKRDNQSDKVTKFSLKHIQGLDIPEIVCGIELSAGQVKIIGGGKEYCLNLQQVLSVSFEMDIDIQKYARSNIATGIVGAAVFGVPGAVVGSAPRTKTQRLVTGCAVISYQATDGSQAFLLLQSPQPNDMQAAKFVDKLRPLLQTSPPQSVQL